MADLRDYGFAGNPLNRVTVGLEPKTDRSPISALEQAMAMNSELCIRVGLLADRLIGAVPAETGSICSPTETAIPPVFYQIGQSSEDAIKRINEAFAAIGRIERALP